MASALNDSSRKKMSSDHNRSHDNEVAKITPMHPGSLRQIKKVRSCEKGVPCTRELVPPKTVALHLEEDSEIDEYARERGYYYSKKRSKHCCLFFGCCWAGRKKRRLEEHLKHRHDWHVEVQGPAKGRRLQAKTKQKRRPGRDLSQYVQRYRVDAEHRWKVNRAGFLKRARADAIANANALLDHMSDGTEKELAVQKYAEEYVERRSLDWDRDKQKKIAQYQKNIKETYNVDCCEKDRNERKWDAEDAAEAYPTTPLSKLAADKASLSVEAPRKARLDEGQSYVRGEASDPASPVCHLQKLPFSIVNKHLCTDPLIIREGNSDRITGVDKQVHKIHLADGWVNSEQEQGLERGSILLCKLYESSMLWVEKTGEKKMDYKHTASASKMTPNFKKEKLPGRSETSSNKTLKKIIQAARERLPNDLYYLIEFTESLVQQSRLNLPLCFAANISVKNGDTVDVTVPGCKSKRIKWYKCHDAKLLGLGWTELVLLHHIDDKDWALLKVTNKRAITFHIYHHKNPSSVSEFREELERCFSDSFEACDKGNQKARDYCKEPISVEIMQDMLHKASPSKIASSLNEESLFEEVNMTRKSETDNELKEIIKAARESLDGRFDIMEFTWATLKHGRSNIPALFAANLSVKNGDTVDVVVPGCKNQHLKWYSDSQFEGLCGPEMRNFIISNDIQVGDWALLQVTGQKKVITFHIYHCKNPSSIADFCEEIKKYCNDNTKLCNQGNHETPKQPSETSRNIADLQKALKLKASQYCEYLTNPFISVEMTEDRLVREFTIGASFILKHMEKGEHVHFYCSDGCSHKFEWTWRKDLIKIWSDFAKEHSLKPSDQLVLEVSDARILKVRIFRLSSCLDDLAYNNE